MPRRLFLAVRLVISLAVTVPLVTGCALNSTATYSAAPAQVGEIHIQGTVHGGQQPLSHSLIQLYQVGVGTVPGSSGYAANAIPLISSAVYTAADGTGSFNITGAYSCSAGAQVYITAVGGSSDGNLAHANPNIALMAALGSCSSLLANASTSYIVLNEVSTVAAAYALAQFSATTAFGTALSAQPGSATVAPADNIATSSGNTQGLINAMSTAAVLASSYSTNGSPTGSSPGNNANGTASVEYWTVNTVANILAACVNTPLTSVATAGDGSPCGTLYQYTTPSGKTAPADTFQAALYMALYPGDANLLSGTLPGQNLANLITGTPPFQPYVFPDGTQNFIYDWTIGISYTPVVPATATKLIDIPYTLAADSVGNIWSYNINVTPGKSYVVELDPTGNPVLAAPTPGSTSCAANPCTTADYEITSFRKYGGSGAINISLQTTTNTFGLAIDPSNNVWFGDRTGKYMIFVAGSGTGSVANGGYLNGAAVGYLFSSGAPVAPAIDGNGVPWFTVGSANNPNCTGQTVTGTSAELASIQGASTSTGKGGTLTYGGPGGVSGSSIAIDAGNPICTGSTSTMLCNPTLYDKLSGSSTALAGSPFVWAEYNTGQGGTLPNSAKATTIGHYLTSITGGFTVAGCESPLGQIGDVDASVAPNTLVPNINPSGSDAIDFTAQGRGIAFGQNNTMWFTNNNFVDANSTIQYSITSYVPTYGTAFTPASFQTASPAFTSYSGGGYSKLSVQALAVDGANSPWAVGIYSASGATQTPLVHLSATGVPLSPSTGFLGSTYYNSSTSTSQHRSSGLAAYSAAIDGSGNVWVPDSDSTSNSIYVLVGVATPVVAPLSLGVRNGTLGMMP